MPTKGNDVQYVKTDTLWKVKIQSQYKESFSLIFWHGYILTCRQDIQSPVILQVKINWQDACRQIVYNVQYKIFFWPSQPGETFG